MFIFVVYYAFFYVSCFIYGELEMFSNSLCRKGEYDLIYEDTSYMQCVGKCRSKKSCFGVCKFNGAYLPITYTWYVIYKTRALCWIRVYRKGILEKAIGGDNLRKCCSGYSNITVELEHPDSVKVPEDLELARRRSPAFQRLHGKAKEGGIHIPAAPPIAIMKTIEGCGDDDCDETCSQKANGDVTCEREECNPIGNILYGTVNGLHNVKVGSKVLFKCDRQINNVNNDVIRKCQSNGQWSGSTPVCPSPECEMLYNIQNGIVQGIEQRTIGSEVSYVCTAQHKVKRGNERRTCLEDLTWSGTKPACLQYEFVLPWSSGHPTYTEFDMFDNDISFVNKDVIVFKVKATNDVHIRLQIYRDNFESSSVIEVILGGWGNTKSVLRQSHVSIREYNENGIVNGVTFSDFWILSSNNCIEVGKGLSYAWWSKFLEYCELTTKYQYLSIGVGYNSGATYIFQ